MSVYKLTYQDFCQNPSIVFQSQNIDETKSKIAEIMKKCFDGIDEKQINILLESIKFKVGERWTIECCYLRSWDDKYDPCIMIINYLKCITIEVT